MQSSTRPLRAAAGLAMLVLSGCYSYYPYGYGASNGIYNAPPSGIVAPPGTMVSPQGTIQGPPGTFPSNGASPGTFTPPRTNGSPGAGGAQFEPERQPNSPMSNEKPVPMYTDPNRVDGGAGGGSDPKRNPFGDGSASRMRGGFVPVSHVAKIDTAGAVEAGFETPIPARTDSAASTDAGEIAAASPNPYDYDRRNYTWLRGKVDYDPGSKSWHIIYNVKPDSGDKYGGGLTLVSSPLFGKLKNDDIVLVEGRVDPSARDRRGKPSYRVDHLFGPLVPKK